MHVVWGKIDDLGLADHRHDDDRDRERPIAFAADVDSLKRQRIKAMQILRAELTFAPI